MNRTPSVAVKMLLTPILVGVALMLIWYGIFSYRVGKGDVENVLNHSSADWFPVVSLWRGNSAYFIDLDPAAAHQYYRRAIAADVVLIDAWLALARAEMSMDHSDRAGLVLETLAPILARTATWKWQELLLAYDLKKEQVFQQAFNHILENMPARRADAIYLALQQWSDYEAIAAHVDRVNWLVWLEALIRLQQADPAFAVWRKIEQDGELKLDDAVQLRFCNYLLGADRIDEARQVWRARNGKDGPEVHNGGFETELTGAGFGWRLTRQATGVTVKRTTTTSSEGAYSLHFRFDGKTNLDFHHLTQYVAVAPGARHRLDFSRKARGITTDQGIFAQVTGRRCKGLDVRSPALTGSEPWKTEQLEFTVPDQCRVVLLQVRRRESLMFDNKIAGEYWLDDVRMSRTEPDPQPAGGPQ